MSPRVHRRVLPLAVHVIGRVIDDLGSMDARALAMGSRIFNPDEDRVSHCAWRRREAIGSDVGDDHRPALANVHLRARILTNLKALGEAERIVQLTAARTSG